MFIFFVQSSKQGHIPGSPTGYLNPLPAIVPFVQLNCARLVPVGLMDTRAPFPMWPLLSLCVSVLGLARGAGMRLGGQSCPLGDDEGG